MEPLLMDLANNVFLEGNTIAIIDRRKLPREEVRVVCRNYEEVARAIEDMVVQGAGDIAVTAGFGLYLASLDGNRDSIRKAAERLKATRPTGFHLAALMDRLLGIAESEKGPPRSAVLAFLQDVMKRQRALSEATGMHAEKLLAGGDTILTHCFPGPALLFMLKAARDNGKDIKVICTETRPYLQGARLTAWSVSLLGLDTTLITDNMAAHMMSIRKVSKVFTAADRIAMDGSAANKVGTLQLAICARYFAIPFYILGYGGPDRKTKTGEDIPIEQRDPREVLEFMGVPISGPEVKALYPAFDVTPRELISAIVTGKGIITFE
ncbi:MAG: s-methyl-5-thioribose-1-phosphate isomerase [Syntrophaceae bacterium]